MSKLPKWAADLTEKASFIMPDMKISEVVHINQNLKKIRFQGDLSRMNFQIGYANIIRVSDTEFRNYTTSYHNIEEGYFDIIFHIHRNGVGSNYIDTLKSGNELKVGIPRGKKMYEQNVKHHLIFGDETSLGIACSVLPLLKQNKNEYQFYFELDDENRNVPELLGLENYTIFSKKDTFRNELWINSLPIFKTNEWNFANYILTGNVKSVQTFRKVLKDKTQGKIYSQGFWLEGKKGL
ncbi:FAD-binding oxidoreductase [Emticicia sp. TH156]|uniref:FAD-binding oxidoreductase n=1 Tax=Emticicia sp. TH156 TaxID=2067454 RepID=UPI000C75AFCC|nr:FAD-binding oxidoreductase [Emticicia sp. TH156]PLK43955.1 siderophore-interacting protein [Emticicia sp. TH156]